MGFFEQVALRGVKVLQVFKPQVTSVFEFGA